MSPGAISLRAISLRRAAPTRAARNVLDHDAARREAVTDPVRLAEVARLAKSVALLEQRVNLRGVHVVVPGSAGLLEPRRRVVAEQPEEPTAGAQRLGEPAPLV